MPQLTPFYFYNEVVFTFVIFALIIYILSKYIFPKYICLNFTRFFLIKLLNCPPKPHAFISLPLQSMPVPGRKCPACLAKGQTVWVIPGKCCPQCGTEVNRKKAKIKAFILACGMLLLISVVPSILIQIYIPISYFMV